MSSAWFGVDAESRRHVVRKLRQEAEGYDQSAANYSRSKSFPGLQDWVENCRKWARAARAAADVLAGDGND